MSSSFPVPFPSARIDASRVGDPPLDGETITIRYIVGANTDVARFTLTLGYTGAGADRWYVDVAGRVGDRAGSCRIPNNLGTATELVDLLKWLQILDKGLVEEDVCAAAHALFSGDFSDVNTRGGCRHLSIREEEVVVGDRTVGIVGVCDDCNEQVDREPQDF